MSRSARLQSVATPLLSVLLGLGCLPLVGAQDPVEPDIAEPDIREPDAEDFDELFDDGLDEILSGDAPVTGADLGAAGNESILAGIRGFAEVRPRLYYRDRGGPRNDQQLLVRGEIELDFRFDSDWTGYFRPRVYLDAVDGDLSRFEPFEAWIGWQSEAGDLDFRVGQFVENWGIADTFNPVDVVNRRDFATDFLDLDRLGEFGLRVRAIGEGGETLGEPTLSLYYLPVWRATPFAPEDQRFAFGSDAVPFDSDAGFEPSGFDRSFLAARFQSTVTTAPLSADLQWVVARGPERVPVVLDFGGRFAPAYFGSWTFGGGLRAVANRDVAGEFLASLTLKAEVVYKRPYSFDAAPLPAPDSFLSYVLGVDRGFYGVIRDEDALTCTLEYAGEDGASTDPTGRFRPFRNDVIARVLWEANDFARTSLEMRGVFDLDTSEVLAEAVFERQLRFVHDDFRLICQLQHFDSPGTGESLFDFFPNNSAVSVGLRQDF